MKYFTKEVSAYLCSTFRHCELVVDERAADDSDDLFCQLYAEAFCPYWQNTLKSAMPAIRNRVKKDTVFHRDLWMLQRLLPSDVLANVSDLRVLALGHVTSALYEEVLKFREKTEQQIKELKTAYNALFARQMQNCSSIFGETEFHDTWIVSTRFIESELHIKVENCGLFLGKNESGAGEIILTECQVLQEEKELKGCSILFDEIYLQNKGYEWHILTDGWNDGLFRCSTYSFSQIRFLAG